MKSSEAEILVIAGYSGASEAHWQRRLVAKLRAAKFVEQEDWQYGSLASAVGAVVTAVQAAQKPVVFVAHAAGCLLVPCAVPVLRELALETRIKGAFLVTPPSEEALSKPAFERMDHGLRKAPRDPLPFPSVLVASSNDPHASLEHSADLAAAWGSKFVEAGAAGQINVESGHGPWPEGMMSFAGFLSRLQA